jgi:hypothetical protein
MSLLIVMDLRNVVTRPEVSPSVTAGVSTFCDFILGYLELVDLTNAVR